MAEQIKNRFSSATGVKNANKPGHWKDTSTVGLYLTVRELPPKKKGGAWSVNTSSNWVLLARNRPKKSSHHDTPWLPKRTRITSIGADAPNRRAEITQIMLM